MGKCVEMLTGKDYPQLCDQCKMMINVAAELIQNGMADDYVGDPEGPSMLVYDRGWFCEGHLGCKNTNGLHDEDNYGEPVSIAVDPPQWVVAVWREADDPRGQDQFLPIAFSCEDWPVHGGVFDEIADRLGWKVVMDNSLTVGGMYMARPRSKSNVVGLVCLDVKSSEKSFFGWTNSAVFVLPTEDIDPREWGLA